MADISIHEEFMEIRERMIASYIEPRMVTFNDKGYVEMLRESGTHDPSPIESKTYMGLPFTIRHEQSGRVALHSSIPGTKIQQRCTQAQICDRIRAWLDADDPSNWGPFERALDSAVVRFGRFE